MSDFMASAVATVPFFVFLCVFTSFCDKLYKAPLYKAQPNRPEVQRTRKQTQLAPNSVFEENKLLFLLFLPLVLSPLRQCGREG